MKAKELRSIMERNGTNAHALAKGLEVKPSMVYTWLERDRIPEGWARYLRLIDSLAMLKTQTKGGNKPAAK